MTAEFHAHIYSDNIIDEISSSLYKHPESAIKELITNGLDAQFGTKYPLVNLRWHVGPTDDIEIEDPGTGIVNLAQFETVGGGEKKVGEIVSSAKIRVEGLAGYKGFGKIGGRMLSGSLPQPVVIWYSRREYIEDGKHKIKCLKITLSKSGFNVETLDSTDDEALKHQGCKVVIKNARYDKLPSFEELIKLISKWYAPRINRGTKIFFDDIKVQAPKDFDSRIFPLFELDNGDWVKGNFRNVETKDRANKENVGIYINNIFVDSLRTDNPCVGWINDDFLTPTTSREAIEGNERFKEIQAGLTYYLNEMYPLPENPKLGNMSDEKQKRELIRKAFKFHNKPISGIYDKDGVMGDINGGVGKDKDKNWIKMEDAELTNTGGAVDGEPIIPIGGGTRKGGTRNGGNGPNPSIKPGGTHPILKPENSNPGNKQGPVTPNFKFIESDLGKNKPMAFTDGVIFTFNTSWKQSQKAWKASGENMKYALAPVVAQAMVNYERNKEEFKSGRMDYEEGEQRYCDYIEAILQEEKK